MSAKSPGMLNFVWPITIRGTPNVSVTSATARSTSSAIVMSAETPIATPPAATIEATASSISVFVRATTATLQPSAASRWATSRPMPLLPPVQNTTLPAMPRSIATIPLGRAVESRSSVVRAIGHREQAAERTFGQGEARLARHAVEELVQGLLRVAVGSFHVGIVVTPHDVRKPHRRVCRHRAAIVLERRVHLLEDRLARQLGELRRCELPVLAPA